MRIVNLIENTEGAKGCAFDHGLSFYVKTKDHELLLDLGPSAQTLDNAKTLGIDLTKIDTVVLSHGHYDHSGGIMPFSHVNDHAKIYMQSSAADDHYSDDGEHAEGERFRYNGIDKDIAKLPQTRMINGDLKIDDELSLFTLGKRTHEIPFTNKRILVMEDGKLVRDDFRHEQYLVISEDSKRILMSGCAHNGILSILDSFTEKFGGEPDVVISGFHLMMKREYRPEEIEAIRLIGKELSEKRSLFVTCHCTGNAYDILKDVMGDKLRYVHSGEEVSYL